MSENQILAVLMFILLLQAITTTCVVGAVAACAWRFFVKRIKVDIFHGEDEPAAPVEVLKPVEVSAPVEPKRGIEPSKPWPRTPVVPVRPRAQIKPRKCYHCSGDIFSEAVRSQMTGVDQQTKINFYVCENCGKESGFPA